jgi:hypothetical protein
MTLNLTPMIESITNHILSIVKQESNPVLFLTGEVISISPLQVRISNKQTLAEDELLLSQTVRETWIDIPTTTDGETPEDGIFMHRHHISADTDEANDGGQGAQNHKHHIEIDTEFALPRIRLWRGLVVGDIVRLLKIQEGQLYYIIEREEKITNETPEVEDGGSQ